MFLERGNLEIDPPIRGIGKVIEAICLEQGIQLEEQARETLDWLSKVGINFEDLKPITSLLGYSDLKQFLGRALQYGKDKFIPTPTYDRIAQGHLTMDDVTEIAKGPNGSPLYKSRMHYITTYIANRVKDQNSDNEQK